MMIQQISCGSSWDPPNSLPSHLLFRRTPLGPLLQSTALTSQQLSSAIILSKLLFGFYQITVTQQNICLVMRVKSTLENMTTTSAYDSNCRGHESGSLKICSPRKIRLLLEVLAKF